LSHEIVLTNMNIYEQEGTSLTNFSLTLRLKPQFELNQQHLPHTQLDSTLPTRLQDKMSIWKMRVKGFSFNNAVKNQQ